MTDPESVFDELPGGLMIWVLIASELLVFGAGLAAFLAVRITDPGGFAQAQAALHRAAAGFNTIVLVTSGLAAALALRAAAAGNPPACRRWLMAAAGLGIAFLAVKGTEFADLSARGITTDTHAFFTFYYLLTGFHAAHVAAGILILGAIAIWPTAANAETGTAFWHMVDLVWVLLFPVIYLLR